MYGNIFLTGFTTYISYISTNQRRYLFFLTRSAISWDTSAIDCRFCGSFESFYTYGLFRYGFLGNLHAQFLLVAPQNLFFFLITATRDVYEKKKKFIYKSLREWFSMFLYRYGCVYKSFCKFNMKKNFKHLEQSKNLLSFISIPFESVVENWLHQWLIYVFYAILNDSYGCWLSYETRVRLKSLNLIL